MNRKFQLRDFWWLLVPLALWVGLERVAFAQDVPAITLAAAPAPLVTLTTPLAVIALLSLLAAYVTQGVSSGQIFGIVTIPKTWLPVLTVLGTFLSTFVTQIVAEGSALSGVNVFNAFVAGMFMLIAPATGTALHHHLNSPGANLATAAALKDAATTVAKAAPIALLLLLLHCGNAAAAVSPGAACVASVIQDALSGMTIAQIVAAAGPGCVTDAEDVVTILIGSGDPRVGSTMAFAQAQALRAVKNSEKGGTP